MASSRNGAASASKAGVSLVWFKNTDLRIHDHLPLLTAHRTSAAVIHLMVVDKFWSRGKTRVLGIPKWGPFRCKFIKESILDLRRNLEQLDSELIVRFGDSSSILPSIIERYAVRRVYYHSEIHSEEQAIVDRVIADCEERVPHDVEFVASWGGNTLYDPQDMPWGSNTKRIPETFTAFRKAVEKRIAVRDPLEALSRRQCRPHPKFAQRGRLSTLKQLGCAVDDIEVDRRSSFPFSGGESAALERMTHYIWGGGDGQRSPLATYKATRNQSLGTEYSTKFSAFLSAGNLSPRLVHREIRRFERSTGTANDSTYWAIFELIWRDFFKFGALKYGDRIFRLHGPFGRTLYEGHRGWSRDMELFRKWTGGQTGFPFVDAAMVELATTGAMSNRLRQNVASFLIKDLGLDWRCGAEWFESMLSDSDPASNYGNWCYIAGVGFDARSASRYFAIDRQAATYDADGEFVRMWLPALQNVDRRFVHKPYAMDAARQRDSGCVVGTDYPAPCCSLSRGPAKRRNAAKQRRTSRPDKEAKGYPKRW